MAEQIIDVGTAPNNGTGDPLRTAFIKTDNNFDQIWAAGPVGTNVRIQNNVISTLQVNQDLALSPNGVGNVRLNNNTIPGANNTWFLGSTTNRWRGLFVGNVTAGNISTVNLNVPGDAYIGGNLTVVGNTIQIGNITTDTLTIQLANTAVTDAAANGAGITVGANDDIATFLYDAGNNVWTTNIGLQVDGAITGTSIAVSDATVYGNLAAINGNFTGNVAANYFFGNGSQLTGMYGNANVTNFLANGFGSNSVATTGNITAGYFLGNGSQLTGIQTGAIISNTAPALGNGGIWWNSVDGRAYVKYANAFIDLSPSLVPDPTTYVGNVSFDDITVTNVGNIIPAGNNAYSLGSAAFQWKDLWVSNNTIYINSVPITLGAGNVLTVDGNAVLQNDSNTSISTTGNITANSFIGDGSQLTGLPPGYTDSDVATFLAAFGSNTISTTGNITAGNFIGSGANVELVAQSEQWVFDTTGNLTLPTAGYLRVQTGIIGAGASPAPTLSGFSSIATTGSPGNISASGNLLAAGYANITGNINGSGATFSGNVTAQNFVGNISITGNVTGTSANVELVAGSYTWTFDNTGIVTLPTIGGNEGGEINFGIPAANTTLIGPVKFDVYQDRIRFFDGSTKGAYIDLSQAATGVNTLLNNRVSGIVNAGTFVTMDNIKATITTSGSRGLSLATVSGTATYLVGGVYGTSSASSGNSGTVSLSTTPTASLFNFNFIGAGDIGTYVLTDGSNARAYRITIQIGTSYNDNLISIERLL